MSLSSKIPLVLMLAVVVVPLATGMAAWFNSDLINKIYSRLAAAAVFLSMLLAGGLYFFLEEGNPPVYILDLLPPLGLSLRLDYLSFYMITLFTFLGFVVTWYSIKYTESDPRKGRLLSFMLFTLGGCYGVALSGDFFTFYLFFEFMSLIYFMLLVHSQTEKALRAGFRFVFMAIVAGVSLFISLVIIYQETGSLFFGEAGLLEETSTLALAAFIGFVVAFGIKIALFPLHIWMPAAYAHAPLPAAFISSSIMLKTGAYGFLRAFGDVFGISYLEAAGWEQVLLYLALFTIVFGSVIALSQDDIIRRLAYSGIAQMGYVLLGVSMLSEASFTGATFHLFAHAFMKGTLFLCAGVIIKGTGVRMISSMRGIGKGYPLVMACFGLASLTAVGMPPFNIFISKWYLFTGSFEQEMLFPVIVLLVSSFLNSCYYLPIVINAFWPGKEETEKTELQESVSMVAADSTVSSYPLRTLKLYLHDGVGHMLLPVFLLTAGCVIFNLLRVNWSLELVKTALQGFF